MQSKYDGHLKQKQICANLKWQYHEYLPKLWSMYHDNKMGGIEIAEYINIKLPKYCRITARSIQRAINKYAKMKGLLTGTRSVGDAFRLAAKKGRVKWAYKALKIKRLTLLPKLRYQILLRDNFKCKLCGNTEILEVDHIKPLHLGGKTEPDNLQTLCHYCNIGKYQNGD